MDEQASQQELVKNDLDDEHGSAAGGIFDKVFGPGKGGEEMYSAALEICGNYGGDEEMAAAECCLGGGSTGSLADHVMELARADYEAFKADQDNKKGSRWSDASLRLAAALYMTSPAAFGKVKQFELLKLPSIRTMRDVLKR